MQEENIGVVNRFLSENSGFELCDIAPLLPEKIRSTAQNGFIQLYPGEFGCDGFFISKIVRKV